MLCLKLRVQELLLWDNSNTILMICESKNIFVVAS